MQDKGSGEKNGKYYSTFRSKAHPGGEAERTSLAAVLKPLSAGFEGIIRAKRFFSLNKEGQAAVHEYLDRRGGGKALARCNAALP